MKIDLVNNLKKNALLEEESLLSEIIGQMPGYIYWKDCESVYRGCNWNLARLSGLNSPEEIDGKLDDDFEWGYGQAKQFRQDDRNVVFTRQKQVSEYQLPIRREDGSWLTVRTEKTPLCDQSDNVIGVLAIAVDVTDQKLLNERIITMTEKANIATQTKAEFLANMCHDLRTPLCGIQGAAEILKKYHTKNPKLSFAIEALNTCSQRLCDCIDNISDFQRIYHNESTLKYESFELKNAMHSLINEYKQQLKEENKHTHVDLNFYYGEKVPVKVITDGASITRIVMNLLHNALKFTEQGEVVLAVNISQNNLILTVKDSGCGIPLNKQEIIFDRFSRLTPSYQSQTPGQGLGLTMVKHLLNRLGGHIQMESDIGRGTSFILFIPIELDSRDDTNNQLLDLMN